MNLLITNLNILTVVITQYKSFKLLYIFLIKTTGLHLPANKHNKGGCCSCTGTAVAAGSIGPGCEPFYTNFDDQGRQTEEFQEQMVQLALSNTA